MRKLLLCLILVTLLGSAFAQAQKDEDWLWGEEKKEEKITEDKDFIQVNFTKKDARRAMMYSLLLPGAGQYYADKSSITTYIFPVVEVGMITGILLFNKLGNDKRKDYEKYANGETITYILGDGTEIQTVRYDRTHQHRVEGILKDLNTVDIYESSYFRLDDTNTQHFYEDIGNYPHYVFGWADWYYTFATDASGADANPIWYPSGYDSTPANPGWIWHGNYPLWGENQSIPVENNTHASSAMRKQYVEMRNEAKDEFAKSRMFTFGLAFNHIAAGLDAMRLTHNVNKGALSDAGFKWNYYTSLREDQLTPTVGFVWNF